MFKYLELVRYRNLLIIALTQYLMRWFVLEPIFTKIVGIELQLSELNFFMLVMSTIFIAAAGYAINDYFDRKTDEVNNPGKVIVGNSVPLRHAMLAHTILNIIGIAIGVYLSVFVIELYKVSFIYIIISAILWFYSTNLKRRLFVGNLTIAVLTALVPLMVLLFEIPLLRIKYNDVSGFLNVKDVYSAIYWVLGFAFFAFITTLIREIVKDAEDIEGDGLYGRQTLPIVLGDNVTKLIIVLLSVLTIGGVFATYFFYLKDLWYLLNDNLTLPYILITIIAPLLLLIYRIITAKTKRDYSFSSLLIKLVMIFGILYSLASNYIIISNF